MRGAHRGIRVVGLLWLFLVGAVEPIWGGSGARISLPIGPKPTVNGLTLSLNCEWVEGRGYRPFTVDVTCTPPPVADRTLEIELSAAVWPTRNFITVNTEIEIPAGSTSVSKLISVPQFAALQYVSLDVSEDGLQLEGLSMEDRPLMTGGLGSWANAGQGELPSLLFVTSTKLDLSPFHFLLNDNSSYPSGNNAKGVSRALQVATFAEQAPADLVENWINYTSLDVIFLALADLENLAATRPKVWQALRRWTCAGGNLCVYGVGDDWHGLKAVDRWLQCPADAEQAGQPHPGWNEPARELSGKKLRLGSDGDTPADEPDSDLAGNDPAAIEPADKAPAADDAETKTEPAKAESPLLNPFVWRQAALGRVVAVASTAPFPGGDDYWQWVFNTISPARWKWRFRHGVSFDQENPDFDNFLISDIGLPPIRTYRVLISLFVIVIGPLNYWLLRRSGRLHLLLFTVPAAALLASGALIGYVFVADGFESRMRARSFTQLDQRHHEAVSWARLSYYTGLAPSGGLLFPSDTAVFPLEKSPAWDSFGGRRRQLAWTPDQHLARGWLASRTPTQYVTVRAYPSERGLTIVPSDDKQRYAVTNRLGAKIKQVVLCDEAGQLHRGAEIDLLGRAPLQRLDADAARKSAMVELAGELNRDPPIYPKQAGTDLSNNTGGFFPAIRSARNTWRNKGDYHTTASSLLEIELGQIATSVAGNNLKPRTYVAIVDHPPDVIVGMEGLIETQSLHVIFGVW